MINEKFGKLTVLKQGKDKIYRNGNKHRTWICQCECGNVTEPVESKLKNGHTQSCGCGFTSKRDLIGKRFGMLTVVKEDGHITKSIAWLCKCDCGNDKRIRGDYLRNGHAKSCGCFQVANRKRKQRWRIRDSVCAICGQGFKYNSSITPNCCSDDCRKQYATDYCRLRSNSTVEQKLRRLVAGVRNRSKEFDIPCDIDSSYILDLLESQNKRCSQTGVLFELTDGDAKSPWSPSIDQIEPSKGYTKDNIQLVCLMYNFCKHEWTNADVVKFAKRLLRNKR